MKTNNQRSEVSVRPLTSLLLLLSVLCPLTSVQSAGTNPVITAVLTVTNNPTGTNGNYLVFQGVTYRWTNLASPTIGYIAATNSATATATNLFARLSRDFTNSLRFSYAGAAKIQVSTFLNGTLTISNSPGWVTNMFTTNAGTADILPGKLSASNLNAVTSITLGGVTKTTWPAGGSSGAQVSSNDNTLIVVLSAVSPGVTNFGMNVNTGVVASVLALVAGTNSALAATTAGISNALALSYPAVFPETNAPLFSISRAAYSTNITLVGSAALSGNGNPIHADISGDVVVVGYSTNVDVFVVTNRSAPVLVSTMHTSGGDIQGVSHKGPFFYITGNGYISVFNCSVPRLSVLTTNIFLTNSVGRSTVSGGFLFAACATPGAVKVFSIQNPVFPVLLSTIPTGSATVADMLYRNGLLYIADYAGPALKVADISNPSSPIIVHSQAVSDHGDTSPFSPFLLMIKDDALFVADDGWLQTFNIRNPTNPIYVSALDVSSDNNDVEGAAKIGDQLIWCASSIYSFDCQNPFALTNFAISSLANTDPTWIAVDENYIYRAVGGEFFITTIPHLPRFGDNTSVLLVAITNTVRFPIASNNVGRTLTVKITDNITNVLTTISPDLLEGAATVTLTNRQAATFQSDGTTNWFLLNRY